MSIVLSEVPSYPRVANANALSGHATDALIARGLRKSFGGNHAIRDVDLEIRKGEVHALIGKNGAGKSTLVKMLAGAHRPDHGRIEVNGRGFAGLTPIAAARAGIATVYQNQEMPLNLTVAASIFLGREFLRGPLAILDTRRMETDAHELLDRLGLDIPVDALLSKLSLPQRQQVAIARAVRQEASVLLLDEPTAALNKAEVAFLFTLIQRLSSEGMGIVYISHHLQEILDISHRVTALRNGMRVDCVETAGTNKQDLIEMMVGSLPETEPLGGKRQVPSDPKLSIRGLMVPGRLGRVSLELRTGEILAVTGILGTGADVLAETLAGLEHGAEGEILLDGALYSPHNVAEAIGKGIIFVPEAMRERGLVLQMSIRKNITLGSLRARLGGLAIHHGAEKRSTEEYIDRFRIAPAETEYEVGNLSGGNQRKVLLARAVYAGGRLLLLEEPTQGVDVDAQREIHAELRRLVDSGLSILLFSTDLEEIITVADRVLVLHKHSAGEPLPTSALTTGALLAAIQNTEGTVK